MKERRDRGREGDGERGKDVWISLAASTGKVALIDVALALYQNPT